MLQITGLEEGELRESADCSCNVYAHGGHLLAHDDVISTRAVSYIIYLTDPESEWQAVDGGALELYPLLEGDQTNPSGVPATCLLPYFNSMAMFTVQPGRSYHSVQEVRSLLLLAGRPVWTLEVCVDYAGRLRCV